MIFIICKGKFGKSGYLSNETSMYRLCFEIFDFNSIFFSLFIVIVQENVEKHLELMIQLNEKIFHLFMNVHIQQVRIECRRVIAVKQFLENCCSRILQRLKTPHILPDEIFHVYHLRVQVQLQCFQ